MATARHDVETLLALRAACGLEETERRELEEALREDPTLDDEGYDHAAAALALAMEPEFEPMPAALTDRLTESASDFSSQAAPRDLHSAGSGPTIVAPEPRAETGHEVSAPPEPIRLQPRTGLPAWSGWLAAAAAVVVAALAWWPLATTTPEPVAAGSPPVAEPTAAELRQELLALPGTTTLAWSATEDPTATGARGDVVWNPELQQGYMRFEQLAANDPSEFQYQLWIFDATRDERYPVDGGVFDVDADGQAVVPISARLPVREATLFAITVEPPGGVVVSSRERIALLAQAGP